VLDIIYLALTLALFALVSLAASAVEARGPRTRSSVPHDTADGEVPA
jgi:hypothetical protein